MTTLKIRQMDYKNHTSENLKQGVDELSFLIGRRLVFQPPVSVS